MRRGCSTSVFPDVPGHVEYRCLMRQCQRCGSLLSVHGSDCPTCGDPEHAPEAAEFFAHEDMETALNETGDLTSEAGEAMIVAARFSNSAEAGYFVEELYHEENIEAKLSMRDHFDALTGRWKQDFVLLVEETQLERALLFLNASTAGAEEPESTTDEFTARSPLSETEFSSGVNWVPILLTTLAAGSVAYWGVKKVEKQPRPPVLKNDLGVREDDLWGALLDSERPWIQHFGHQGGIRLLRVAPDGSAVIQEDRDGDGQFERKLHFRREGAARK